MNDVLRDVISVAAERSSRSARNGAAVRHDVQPKHVNDTQGVSVQVPGSAGFKLDRNGLRQAFWICGFHEVLLDRERQGERLTDREQSLIALSRRDFPGIRAAVVELALQHLHAVVHDTAILSDNASVAPSAAEVFAIGTMRNLAVHGRQTLQQDGPDVALSLFGGDEATIDPLSIFQAVFSAALNLLETLDRLTPEHSGVLARLAAALDSEVGKI